MSEFLSKLSEIQAKAVTTVAGPSLIIAGAGSGKTRVLTYRIAYLLDQGVKPSHILALTFTNKASKEMKERVTAVLSAEKTRYLWIGTFHALFARMLRNEADKLGYPSNFTIYDTADSRNVIRAIIKELNLSDDYYKPSEIGNRISLSKNNLVTAASYAATATYLAEDRERRRPQFAEVFRLYEARCRANGAMDFDDLLLNMNILFRDFPAVLAKYQEQFRYIMVDEYQDTNAAQYLIIKRLAESHRNICVVGDDAQSIYSFRGATIENILRFQKDYPQAQVFKLEQNYRSTQTIVNAANSLINHNKRQLHKSVFSENDTGEKILVMRAYTDREEASLVTGAIFRATRGEHVPYGDIAILYRTNAQSRVFEEALRGMNIPYKIHGGLSFYQRKEIKDILAYVRLVLNHRDDEALMRIINYPIRGIGDVTVGKIRELARVREVSMWEIIQAGNLEETSLRAAAGKLNAFATLITELTIDAEHKEAYEMGLEVGTRSGIIGGFKMQQTPEAISTLENIEELLNSIKAFSEQVREEDPELEVVTIHQWLGNVSLLTEAETGADDGNHVNLMTIHAAKGLEFGRVYVVGMEDNLFPSQMCLSSVEGEEEERRLFYVALTRAKEQVVLSLSQSRYQWGKPVSHPSSRFLKEIDPVYLDVLYDDTEPDSLEDSEDDGFEESRSVSSNCRGGGSWTSQKASAGSWNRERGPSRPVPESSGASFGSYRAGRGGAEILQRGSCGLGAGPSGRGAVAPRPEVVSPLDVTRDKRFRKLASLRETSRLPISSGGTTSSAPISALELGQVTVGTRLEHKKFGLGTVSETEESPNGLKLTVEFEREGRKVLFARLAPIRIVQ